MDDRMAAVRRLVFLGLSGSALWLLPNTIAGCSSQSVTPGSGPNGSTPVGTAGSGSVTPGDPSTPGVPGSAGATGTPPGGGTCGGVLPASYNAICNTCHTQSGTANARYPDLYQFKGTLAEFTEHVRKGSTKGMAAYAPELNAAPSSAAIASMENFCMSRSSFSWLELRLITASCFAIDRSTPCPKSRRR